MSVKLLSKISSNFEILLNGSSGLSGFHHARQKISRAMTASNSEVLRKLSNQINPWLSRRDKQILRAASKISIPKESGPAVSVSSEFLAPQHLKNGVVPVSFVYPRAHKILPTLAYPKAVPLAKIIPGNANEYTSEKDYLFQYQVSWLALSPKKLGWETMRTLEIIFSGCFPLIDGADSTCEHTLPFHPKSLYSKAYAGALYRGEAPSFNQFEALKSHAEKFLTPRYLIQYVCSIMNIHPSDICFLSATEGKHVGYLDAGLIAGMAEVDEVRANGLHPAYTSEPSKSKELHGEGFSYSAILDSAKVKKIRSWSNEGDFKAVLVLGFQKLAGQDVLDKLEIIRTKYEKVGIIWDSALGVPLWMDKYCKANNGVFVFSQNVNCKCRS